MEGVSPYWCLGGAFVVPLFHCEERVGIGSVVRFYNPQSVIRVYVRIEKSV